MSIELIAKQVRLNTSAFKQAKKLLKTAFPKKEQIQSSPNLCVNCS